MQSKSLSHKPSRELIGNKSKELLDDIHNLEDRPRRESMQNIPNHI